MISKRFVIAVTCGIEKHIGFCGAVIYRKGVVIICKGTFSRNTEYIALRCCKHYSALGIVKIGIILAAVIIQLEACDRTCKINILSTFRGHIYIILTLCKGSFYACCTAGHLEGSNIV